MDARIIPIGNSKGIRLPKRLLVKYGFDETVVIRELDNGILLEKEGTSQLLDFTTGDFDYTFQLVEVAHWPTIDRGRSQELGIGHQVGQ